MTPRTHGMSGTRIYEIWYGMRSRCNNQSDSNWHKYGGRGITVCERWNTSFEAFLEDMGQPPTNDHSIDRIDNDKGYDVTNCRWASRIVQCRNRRNTTYITANGKTLPLADWAEKMGVDGRMLHLRIKRGWTDDEVINGRNHKNTGVDNSAARLTPEQVTAMRNESGLTNRQLAAKYGVSPSQVRNILSGRHWKNNALGVPLREGE